VCCSGASSVTRQLEVLLLLPRGCIAGMELNLLASEGLRAVIPYASYVDDHVDSEHVCELVHRGYLELCPWYSEVEPYEHSAEALLQNGINGHAVCAAIRAACSDVLILEFQGMIPPALPRVCRLLGIRALILLSKQVSEPRETRICIGSACVEAIVLSSSTIVNVPLGNAVDGGEGSLHFRELRESEIDEVIRRIVRLPRSGLEVLILRASASYAAKVARALERRGFKPRFVCASTLVDMVLGRLGSQVQRGRVDEFGAPCIRSSFVEVENVLALHLGIALSLLSSPLAARGGAEMISDEWSKLLRDQGISSAEEVVLRLLADAVRGRGIAFVNPVPYRVPAIVEIRAPAALLDGGAVVKWGELEPIDVPRDGVARLGVLALLSGAGAGFLELYPMGSHPKVFRVSGAESLRILELDVDGGRVLLSIAGSGKRIGFELAAEYLGSALSWRRYVARDGGSELVIRRYSGELANAIDIEVRNAVGLKIAAKIDGLTLRKLLYYTPWIVREGRARDTVEVVFHEYLVLRGSKEVVAIATRGVQQARVSQLESCTVVELSVHKNASAFRIAKCRDLAKCIALAASFSRPPIGTYVDSGDRYRDTFIPLLALEPSAELSSAKPCACRDGAVVRLASPLRSAEVSLNVPTWVREVCKATVFEKPVHCIEVSEARRASVFLERGGAETLIFRT